VGDIRGKGLLVGIELVRDVRDQIPYPRHAGFGERVAELAWERGVIVRSGRGTIDGRQGEHLLLAPPLTIGRPELTEVVEVLDEVLPLAAAECDNALASSRNPGASRSEADSAE
jgi:adenosylmethionine-8-amino-7-oxononanoate aminotransferase